MISAKHRVVDYQKWFVSGNVDAFWGLGTVASACCVLGGKETVLYFLWTLNSISLSVPRCFYPVFFHIQMLWELVLLGEALVVMAPSPAESSDTVLALVRWAIEGSGQAIKPAAWRITAKLRFKSNSMCIQMWFFFLFWAFLVNSLVGSYLDPDCHVLCFHLHFSFFFQCWLYLVKLKLSVHKALKPLFKY